MKRCLSSAIDWTGSSSYGYKDRVFVAPIIVGLLGLVVERLLLRRFYGGENHLKQVLLTFGIAVAAVDIIEWGWGPTPLPVPVPELLGGQVPLFGIQFPIYRLAIIVFGVLLAIGLWLFLERTRLGAIVRAGVADAKMVSGLGIDIERVFTAVFVFGTILAVISGIIGAPHISR